MQFAKGPLCQRGLAVGTQATGTPRVGVQWENVLNPDH